MIKFKHANVCSQQCSDRMERDRILLFIEKLIKHKVSGVRVFMFSFYLLYEDGSVLSVQLKINTGAKGAASVAEHFCIWVQFVSLKIDTGMFTACCI